MKHIRVGWSDNYWLPKKPSQFAQEVLGNHPKAIQALTHVMRCHAGPDPKYRNSLAKRARQGPKIKWRNFTLCQNQLVKIEHLGLGSPSTAWRVARDLEKARLIRRVSSKRYIMTTHGRYKDKLGRDKKILVATEYQLCEPLKLMAEWWHCDREDRPEMRKRVEMAILEWRGMIHRLPPEPPPEVFHWKPFDPDKEGLSFSGLEALRALKLLDVNSYMQPVIGGREEESFLEAVAAVSTCPPDGDPPSKAPHTPRAADKTLPPNPPPGGIPASPEGKLDTDGQGTEVPPTGGWKETTPVGGVNSPFPDDATTSDTSPRSTPIGGMIVGDQDAEQNSQLPSDSLPFKLGLLSVHMTIHIGSRYRDSVTDLCSKEGVAELERELERLKPPKPPRDTS